MRINLLASCFCGMAVMLFLVPKACQPTWFKPKAVRIIPIALPENSCIADPSGRFARNRPIGFAVNFQNEYVVEAAIEPGIKGIADTLTNFSISIPDETGNWQNVTSKFYYGVPEGCDWVSENGITDTHPCGEDNRNCRWCFSLPDNPMPKAEIQAFVSHFNQIGPDATYDRSAFPKTGLDVANADFTFWAKPEFAKEFTDLYLQVGIKTASGKNWQQQIHY